MRSRARVPALFALVVASCLGACGGSTEPTTNAPTIHLSASQAAVLSSRVAAVAAGHPELAWLADSVSLVLQSGVEADRIALTTDLAAGPFYAVGLQRALVSTTNSFATFDLIAFDDPSNPSDFIIVDGYAPGAGTQVPLSVSGPFGGTAVHGYLFHVAGSTVTTWTATSGGASLAAVVNIIASVASRAPSLAAAPPGAACIGFQSINGVTCVQSALQASFSMTATNTASGGSSQTASLAATTVAGILLSFR